IRPRSALMTSSGSWRDLRRFGERAPRHSKRRKYNRSDLPRRTSERWVRSMLIGNELLTCETTSARRGESEGRQAQGVTEKKQQKGNPLVACWPKGVPPTGHFRTAHHHYPCARGCGARKG